MILTPVKNSRAKDQGNLLAEEAESPFKSDNNNTNSTVDPCHCYLWKKPSPLPAGNINYRYTVCSKNEFFFLFLDIISTL